MDYKLVEKFIQAIKVQENLIARCHAMVKLILESKEDLNISMKIQTLEKAKKKITPKPEGSDNIAYPIFMINPGGKEYEKYFKQLLESTPEYKSLGFEDLQLPGEASIIMLNQVLIFYNKQLNQTKKDLDAYLRSNLVKKTKQIAE